ncbi:MerR family transcriptional regulator [Geomicrobium sp. JSM 1781026]|uniref:MerR family transcriptional regulator n=1 Tax=unclassified Geomicrobium TaxID=2628951 RepID=UPI00045F28A4|nr:MerR family transcriptional regulator [Geomicrobium sp. JCM 19039]GAK12437.1 MerR-family transcriptional regulator [Geomicrobium sp. JCM 19039]
MKISELSNRTGVSTRSIRYYEKKRLIQPFREENGYRVYDEQDIERVKAIQLFLDIGLKTDEIQPVIACGSIEPTDGDWNCADSAITLYEEKLLKTRQQIEQLENSQKHLKELIDFWHLVKQRQSGIKEQ